MNNEQISEETRSRFVLTECPVSQERDSKVPKDPVLLKSDVKDRAGVDKRSDPEPRRSNDFIGGVEEIDSDDGDSRSDDEDSRSDEVEVMETSLMDAYREEEDANGALPAEADLDPDLEAEYCARQDAPMVLDETLEDGITRRGMSAKKKRDLEEEACADDPNASDVDEDKNVLTVDRLTGKRKRLVVRGGAEEDDSAAGYGEDLHVKRVSVREQPKYSEKHRRFLEKVEMGASNAEAAKGYVDETALDDTDDLESAIHQKQSQDRSLQVNGRGQRSLFDYVAGSSLSGVLPGGASALIRMDAGARVPIRGEKPLFRHLYEHVVRRLVGGQQYVDEYAQDAKAYAISSGLSGSVTPAGRSLRTKRSYRSLIHEIHQLQKMRMRFLRSVLDALRDAARHWTDGECVGRDWQWIRFLWMIYHAEEIRAGTISLNIREQQCWMTGETVEKDAKCYIFQYTGPGWKPDESRMDQERFHLNPCFAVMAGNLIFSRRPAEGMSRYLAKRVKRRAEGFPKHWPWFKKCTSIMEDRNLFDGIWNAYSLGELETADLLWTQLKVWTFDRMIGAWNIRPENKDPVDESYDTVDLTNV